MDEDPSKTVWFKEKNELNQQISQLSHWLQEEKLYNKKLRKELMEQKEYILQNTYEAIQEKCSRIKDFIYQTIGRWKVHNFLPANRSNDSVTDKQSSRNKRSRNRSSSSRNGSTNQSFYDSCRSHREKKKSSVK